MNFRTEIVPERKADITHRHRLMLIGSCFSQNIGSKFLQHKFRADINPSGILYNPASIGKALRRMLRPEPYTKSDLFQAGGLWHSFDHHGSFSAENPDECLGKINAALARSARNLAHADVLVVTFGTAWTYRLKTDGSVVGNCHKLQENTFLRTRLAVDEIVADFSDLIGLFLEKNPEMRVIFTVSPIRHKRDGMHGNQLSKATLLLAVDALQKRFPHTADYFPAYELLTDDLRDYRFYEEDMIHPNSSAINYLWEKFSDSYFSDETKAVMREAYQLTLAENHRPLNAGSSEFAAFQARTEALKAAFRQRHPDVEI